MIGIIGGTGLEDSKILKNTEEKTVSTPWGDPSSPITLGEIAGKKVAILSRHGRKHQFNPTKVNYRANIWALKELGCHRLLASTACGSLQEEMHPGELVIADNFIDWTRHRTVTFFEKDQVAHVPMADPFCPTLRKNLADSAKELNLSFHSKGTIVTIEGPRFSTRAESHLFRSIKADVINMTTVPEVILAREAGMCYATIALVTDYDCWKETEESVDIATVLRVMKQNAENAKMLFIQTISKIEDDRCHCQQFIEKSLL